MKQPKKLTRKQKEIVSCRYKAENWMLVEETEDSLRIIHKKSNKIKTVDKYRKRNTPKPTKAKSIPQNR